MLVMFIFFFFFLYSICEILKYKKIETIKIHSTSNLRLYNEPVVYIKLILIIITFVLLVVRRFTQAGLLENSAGLKSSLFVLAFFAFLLFLSFNDVRKVKSGHNDNIYELSEKGEVEE